MKKFINLFFMGFFVIFLFSDVTLYSNEIPEKAKVDSDIFWNNDGTYFVIKNDNPCDRAYIENEDGSGYELIYDCHGVK